MTSPRIAQKIAEELSHDLTNSAQSPVKASQVEAALKLLAEGNTVPFIARYRKEVTGGLDDAQLRAIEERSNYLKELEERKLAVIEAIQEQGKLTDDLKAMILGTETKARLEDLYLPFKKRRKTKADIAREAGLEPLLDTLLADATKDPETAAADFLTEGFEDAKKALDGARAILIDQFSLDANLKQDTRDQMFKEGTMQATVVEGKEQEGAKYKDYFEFAEPFQNLPSHRILALLRGEAEGVLHLNLDAGDEEIYKGMIARTIQDQANESDKTVQTESDWVQQAIRWGWRTKLYISASLDTRTRLKEFAEEGALQVFAKNLKDVLLAAPAGQRATLGLDPGYRNGVKCAVVDETGKVLDTLIVYPHQPQNQWSQAKQQLATAVATHGVDLLAIGNGTASRETEKLANEVADLIKQAGGKRPTPVVVSESGASVYSASAYASQEFPDMDVSLRGAVSIARRLQDPLAELVKIDPKAIGVGQYQHDVNQANLAKTLDAVVEDAVNAVGVDLNTASVPLLNRVAGINDTLAHNIVAYRDENGSFASRKELNKVPRLGPKAFEQCAGFLRINGGVDPLDGSAVHPEAYSVVKKIAAKTGLSTKDLIGNTAVIAKLNPADFADEKFGVPTVTDILAELDKPGRDPRPEFKTATFKEGVEKISDLKEGMILEGTVTNVAAFGAFVDVGVHQDGLVHVSALSDKFVTDPHEVVRSGQVVKVKVMEVDVHRQRIGLSMRLTDEPGQPNKPQRRDNQRQRNNRGNRSNQRANASGGSLADALKKAGFGR